MVPGPGVELRSGGQSSQEVQGAAVRLIRAERIPSRCGVVVEAKVHVERSYGSGMGFVQPDMEFVRCTELQIEDGHVEPDEAGRVLLMVRNDSPSSQLLPAEQVVGCVECCELEDVASGDKGQGDGVACVSQVEGSSPRSEVVLQERKAKLAKMLQWDTGRSRPEEECELLEKEVLRAHDVFAVDDDERGEVKDVQHGIDPGGSTPIRQAPRRVPFAVRPQLAKLVEDMLHGGVIQESCSPWASPVVLVRKKDGSLRFCVDYRRLNAVTRKDVFPLPRIDDLLDQLSGKKDFSTLDAKSGYWQIPVEARSIAKTAFVTMSGLFEFRVMPFGLCNAPATFQRLMQRVLAGLGGEEPFCSVHIDDVIVFSDSVEEHVRHLRQVFGRLRQAGLKLHPKKCQFARCSVLYHGY